ncbi:MAG: rhamnogalacturonan acetylesterase [Spirochaetaceae bacterium]|jgi:lysophospholipase L1-like esterase|nr:rhamnogalacturonan acetylesterase [Spirochaetaceae bacterium]
MVLCGLVSLSVPGCSERNSGHLHPDGASPGRIFLAGDSTVCDYGDDPDYTIPRNGWGMYLAEQFRPECTIAVTNLAKSGRSSKSFAEETDHNNYFPLVKELKAGDYLFVQFGHNDNKPSPGDEYRYTDPVPSKETEGSFKWYLYEKYVRMARGRGALPVLVTPIVRRNFTGSTLNDTHGAYAAAVRELARDTGVPLIDLTAKTAALYDSLGPEGSAVFHSVYKDPARGIDNTHLNAAGARKVAGFVAQGIFEVRLVIACYLRGA